MLLFCQIPEMRYKEIYIDGVWYILWPVCGIDDINKLVLVLFMNIFIIWFVTVTNIAVDEVSSIAANQEEADTRIVLHDIYAK